MRNGGLSHRRIRHIRAANRGADGADLLTPSERERIAGNFVGYDISPDMVRLSRVNMHLHGFASPNIQEYDTLTSEEFWTQYADVILANPPFMSPKGGIRPHARFSVQSKRSEVLFTDYIAEHLAAGGRAGIIVPEGVIFQSQTAHTQLRKMLVEKHLAAVVSLPAGVFQPYSGVKTSILILDNDIARRTDRIAFFKVESDGFDLGAQRRPIERNDLPAVRAELAEYLRLARTGDAAEFAPERGLIVEKARIAANGDFNLSGERYRETRRVEGKYPMVRIDEVAAVRMGETLLKGDMTGYGKPVFSADSSDAPWAYTDSTRLTFGKDSLVIGARGTIGSVKFPNIGEFTCTQTTIAVTANAEKIAPAFLYRLLKAFDFKTITEGVGIPMITVANVNQINIPLPPMDVQREIVREVEEYQRVLDGARAVVEGWRPRIAVDAAWPMARLGDVCEIKRGTSITRKEMTEGPYPVIAGGQQPSAYHTQHNRVGETITVSGSGAYAGFVAYFNEPIFASDCSTIKPIDNALLPKLLFTLLKQKQEEIYELQTGMGQPHVYPKDLAEIEVPLPPMDVQREIVEEIDWERSLVDANRELMERMASRIAGAVGRAWGAAGG